MIYIPPSQIELEKEFVGSGSYGVVKKAKYFLDDRVIQCAVKLIHMQGGIEGRYGEMLIKELGVMAQIPFHPNVINIYGRTEWEELWQVGIVMPYFDLGSLDSHLYKNTEKCEFGVLTKAYLVFDIVSGMEFLHSHNIVHGDIAARNMLLFRDDDKRVHAVITDFGMAVIEQKEHAMGLKGSEGIYRNRGPLKWMAPESLQNHHATKMSDVYSFAITAWEIFFEMAPWNKSTPQEAAKQVIAGGRPPLDDILKNDKTSKFKDDGSQTAVQSSRSEGSDYEDSEESWLEPQREQDAHPCIQDKKEVAHYRTKSPMANFPQHYLSGLKMRQNTLNPTYLTSPQYSSKNKSFPSLQEQITRADTILTEMQNANVREAVDHENAETPEDHLKIAICHVIRESWCERPDERPTFAELKEKFSEMFQILFSEEINDYDYYVGANPMSDYQQSPDVLERMRTGIDMKGKLNKNNRSETLTTWEDNSKSTQMLNTDISEQDCKLERPFKQLPDNSRWNSIKTLNLATITNKSQRSFTRLTSCTDEVTY